MTRAAVFAVVLAGLAGVAALSPAPDRLTDRAIYEATASQGIVPDCSDLHCFRVLVAWTLGAMPGPSLLKWKAYAVVANACAALTVMALSLTWGLPRRAAVMAALLSAFGFGALYTLHDVFTSDPLMYALGPIVVWLLWHERVAVAAAVASIGVLAKEFVAAPVYVFAAVAFLERRRALGWRALAAANCALIAWLLLQFTLMLRFNYGYADNSSTHLLSGGYLATWLSNQSATGAVVAMVNEFGALWLLAPIGLLIAPRPVQLFALASIPAALVFAYVQQPDRALWNFHFIVTPLAALVLHRFNPAIAWGTIAAFAFANLRLGAQLTMVPAARFALVLSVLLVLAGVAAAWRAGQLNQWPWLWSSRELGNIPHADAAVRLP
jgi:hypothetical protein